MKRIILLIAMAIVSVSVTSCTTYVSETSPKWYPYGTLSVFKQLSDSDTFLIKGESPGSSGITILESDARTIEIDVTEIGSAWFNASGMFRVEVDGKRLTPKEEVARLDGDPTMVVRRGGRVSYDLPAYYEKIVINFYDVTLKGFIFKVSLN